MRTLTVWRLKNTVTSTVQAAKEWQRQLRLPTTPSGGNMHGAQKPKSKLKFFTLENFSNISTLTVWGRNQ